MNSISLFYLLSRFVPVDYYVILYSCVYILSPYVNRLINTFDIKAFRTFLIIILFAFSIEPFGIDVLQNITKQEFAGLSTIGIGGSQNEYTIINFLLLYIVGAYIQKCEKEIAYKENILYLCLIQIACWLILFVWLYASILGGVSTSVLDYHNPIMIISAVATFMIFKNLKI